MGTLKSELIVSLRDMASGPARGLLGTMRRLSSAGGGFMASQRAAMAPMAGSVRGLLAMGAGYVGIRETLGGTVGAAIRFESAFADIRKVVDASDEQFANMATTIKQMSRELPITATDIAALYAAAGESGVATSDLKAFSEMAAKVGIAFDMSAGDAGESLAKLKTQLNLSVEETGFMADAINHLSNNMASNARQITAYMLRVGKFAEMGGFNKEEVAAIGSAMISAGAEAEVAGTSMMNVVRKMTSGEFAKKDQRTAAKALGLDLPSLAKQMQKDAPKALKTVLKAIAKAPKEKQISLLSQFFGDEARAFSPLVGNIQLLDDALGSVADQTKYAGSAFKEYVARANTTANVLQLLRNKVAYQFEGIGEKWLPTIRSMAEGVGDVLDTLDQRVGPLDRIGNAFKGFMDGFGGEGGMRAAMGRFGDMLFGPIADGSKAADEMGRLFADFREWGKAVREFADATSNNPVVKFLGEISGYGFSLAVAGAGFAIIAGAIRKLAGALYLLSGAKAAIGILKTLAQGGKWLANATALTQGAAQIADGAGGGKGKGGGSSTPVGVWGRAGTWLKGLGIQAAFASLVQGLADTPGDTFEDQVANQRKAREQLQRMMGIDPDGPLAAQPGAGPGTRGRKHKREPVVPWGDAASPQSESGWWRRFLFGAAAEPGFDAREHFRIARGTGPAQGAGGPSEVSILGTPPVTISGTPQVTLTNPPPRPNVTIHAPITVNGITDLDMIGRHLQSKVREAASGIQADMVYSPGM